MRNQFLNDAVHDFNKIAVFKSPVLNYNASGKYQLNASYIENKIYLWMQKMS